MRLRLLSLAAVIALLAGITASLQAQKSVTIMQLQTVSRDSLLRLDTLQGATGAGTLDNTPYWHNSNTLADTVVVTGILTVAPGTLTYTLNRYNIYIQDTTTGQVFAGLNVLTNDTSAAAQLTGINALDSGYVVQVTGRVLEYGSQNNSLTEMYAYSTSAPVFTAPVAVNVLDIRSRPAPFEVTVDSFAVGTKPMPSRGEKYEGMYVIIRNVTVVAVDQGSGRFTFADANNNQMTMYDGSGWYTYRTHKFTGTNPSTYVAPPVGTTLSYIRGVIVVQSKSGTCGDYQIMPMYPGPHQKAGSTYAGDIVVNKYSPSITDFTRKPSPMKSTDSVHVTFNAADLNNGGVAPDSVFFNYKVGRLVTNYTKIKLTGTGNLFSFTIPPAAKDSMVSYYAEAYAGGVYGTAPDVTVPKYYVVRDNGYSIYDIQYTPYVNGLPGFLGDTLTVGGIITADTTDIKVFYTGRPDLWMASKSGAWNGIAIWADNAAIGVDTLQHGDSVVVTGIVYDTGSETSIKVLQCQFITRGGAGKVPAPTTVAWQSSPYLDYALGAEYSDGTPAAEQYEGVLIKITGPTNTPVLYQRNADDVSNGANSCFGEFFITSSMSSIYGLRVDDNGMNNYYADTNSYYRSTRFAIDHPGLDGMTQKTILIPQGKRLSFIQGIFAYNHSNYKLEPRTNADFGVITSVLSEDPTAVVKGYELTQNYPNPFNPTTNIRYSIPNAGHVSLKIYNMLGQVVETLVDNDQAQGAYVVSFDAARLSTGVYFYRIESGSFSTVKKMILLK